MKRRTRYLFIFSGLIVFLILAPIIVFYVGGINFNFSGERYVRTGILAVESEPKNATISMNGEQRETTPASIRFIEPGEYEISLGKEGYFGWRKRLEIKPGLATRASGGMDKVYLIKKNTGMQTVSDNVIDYYAQGNFLAFLTPDNLNIIYNQKWNEVTKIPLPGSFTKIQASPNHNYLLLAGAENSYLLKTRDNDLVRVADLVSRLGNVTVHDNGTILGLQESKLFSIHPGTPNATEVLDNISSFSVTGDSLYYIQTLNKTHALFVTTLANPQSNLQLLFNNVFDNLATAQILVTPQKNIILFNGAELYSVNSRLEKISSDVKEISFSLTAADLTYITPSEMYWYDFVSNQSHLITRTAETMSSPQLARDIGYAFYIHANELHVMELDTRDRQNTYTLHSNMDLKHLTLGLDNKIIYFLNSSTLRALEVR
jgi:hypothetical protein